MNLHDARTSMVTIDVKLNVFEIAKILNLLIKYREDRSPKCIMCGGEYARDPSTFTEVLGCATDCIAAKLRKSGAELVKLIP